MNEERIGESIPTAQLTLSHTHKDDFGGRSITLWLDGQKIATLSTGKSVTQEIEPGQHRLRADNTFLPKTIEFDIQPGEHVQYRIWNRSGFGTWMIGVFGSGPLYLMFERLSGDPLVADTENEEQVQR